MVAEFRGEKDHPTLLRAFRRVLDQVGHAKLLLAGEEGRKGAKIRDLVIQLELQESRCNFLGSEKMYHELCEHLTSQSSAPPENLSDKFSLKRWPPERR